MKKLKICEKGHRFYKSSTCESCPTCAKLDQPKEGFLSLLVAPARRAMENNGICEVAQLAKYTQKEILSLHGVGPSSLPIFKLALQEAGLDFRSED